MADNQLIKDAIATAIQMEKDGYAFYTKASAQTTNQSGSKIFASLAQDELLHLETFKRLFVNEIDELGIPFLLIHGNHEDDSTIKKAILEEKNILE